MSKPNRNPNAPQEQGENKGQQKLNDIIKISDISKITEQAAQLDIDLDALKASIPELQDNRTDLALRTKFNDIHDLLIEVIDKLVMKQK